MTWQTRYAATDAERLAFANMLSWAFGTSQETSRSWLAQPGAQHARLGFVNAELIAGLLEIPMGQWFGGRRVPTLGIAGVAVSPEARGQGHAVELMRETLRDARSAGFALSTLYPAAIPLYRNAGYELAGTYCRYETQLSELPRLDRGLEVRTIEERNHSAVEATYQRVAARSSGYLDRGPYVWARVRQPGGSSARGVMAVSDAGVEGYAYLRQKTRPDSPQHDLELSDFIADTRDAALTLLSYLARHRSTATSASWHGTVADPTLLHLTGGFRVSVEYLWMLRVVDVQSALLTRGYPAVATEVSLEIDDELLPENAGLYRLKVSDGATGLERSEGNGDARLNARALACLYSGFSSATQLSAAGLLEADPVTLVTLDRLFAGPSPGLADFF